MTTVPSLPGSTTTFGPIAPGPLGQ
jgi:hypothetical protein